MNFQRKILLGFNLNFLNFTFLNFTLLIFNLGSPNLGSLVDNFIPISFANFNQITYLNAADVATQV